MTLPTADAVMMPTNVDTPALTKLSVSVVPVTSIPPMVVSIFLKLLWYKETDPLAVNNAILLLSAVLRTSKPVVRIFKLPTPLSLIYEYANLLGENGHSELLLVKQGHVIQQCQRLCFHRKPKQKRTL